MHRIFGTMTEAAGDSDGTSSRPWGCRHIETGPQTLRYHLTMRALNQPVSWWGWHWEPPVPMSVIDLIGAGSMSARLAAMFWVAMERGASLLVAANPPSAGKTTTLSALLSFTPPQTAVYFTRGQGETFALPAPSSAYPTYLLINEMSDHIPVYTWDDHARRVFELASEGYRLATTMHADTVEGVLAQLEGELSIPRRQIANLTFIVPLYVSRYGDTVRRVQEVDLLQPDGDDFSITVIANWDRKEDSFEVLAKQEQREALARWAGVVVGELEAEIRRREGFLESLLTSGIHSIPEVNSAIEDFHRQTIKGGA